jgi:hypothetical protein
MLNNLYSCRQHFGLAVAAQGAGQNHAQLDQREAPAEARSRASCTQERIRSPKSAMNA